jgi:myo-inositol catabolism protein IolS
MWPRSRFSGIALQIKFDRARVKPVVISTRRFGKTGWRVYPVGLGCWQFGGAITIDGKPDGWTGVDDNESEATIQRAVELGVNFFDTADMYGWGHSEEILGRALKNILPMYGGRDHVYIATKVGFWHNEAGQRVFGETRDYIMHACDASLRRLQTDHIDLYQCHLWRTERWSEFLDAFEKLQRKGKIRFYGVSTNDLDMVERFNSRKTLTSVMSNYNLLDRHVERDIFPYCRQHDIAFIARGPLAMGKLTGKYSKDAHFDAQDIRSRWLEGSNRRVFEQDLALAERLRAVAEQRGNTLAQLAVRHVLARNEVCVVIPGAKNRQQLEENVSADELPPLDADERAVIEQAFAPS